MNLVHERCEERFPRISDNSLDLIVTDPPFNVSALARGETSIGGFKDHVPFKRVFGEWDFDFSPLYLIEQAGRTLKPGGWLIVKSGDQNFGMTREFGACDPSTLKHYVEFLERLGMTPSADWQEKLKQRKRLNYKATISWHKFNPMPSTRKATLRSSVEHFQVLQCLDDDGKPAKPVAWNFLSQSSMHNFIEGPITPKSERLYWHWAKGQAIPCLSPWKCPYCRQGFARQNHPTQTPLYVWRWIYERYTTPGLVVFDPYAGVGTGGIAAKKAKLDWFGSEAKEEFAVVGNMWADGVWKVPVHDTLEQRRLTL